MIRTATRRPALTPQAKARQLKLLQATAERITRENFIVFIAGITNHVRVINKRTLKEKRLDLVQASAVSETAIKWNIGLYALCRDGHGNNYLKGEEWLMPDPVRQRNIHQSLNRRHLEFNKREVNRSHLLTLAWAACSSELPDMETAYDIFDKLGAWSQLDVALEIEGGGMGVVELLDR